MAKPKPGDANWSDAGYEISLGQERLAQRLRDIEGLMVVSETNPVTGGIENPTASGKDVLACVGASYPIKNPAALMAISAKLAKAEYQNVVVNVLGDSITYGTYSNDTSIPTDAVADEYGFVGRLRQKLARRYGKNAGGFIPANHSANVLSAVGSAVGSIGIPQTCCRVDGTPVTHGLTLPVAGTITFALPKCTNIDIWYFESNTNIGAGSIANTGTFSYAVDGGGATTTTADNTAPVNYKRIQLTGLSDAAHSLVLTGVSGSCYILGAFYFTAAGCVSVNKFGVGSGTALDFTGESSQNFISAAGRHRAWGFIGAGGTPTTMTGSITSGSAVVTGLSSTAALKQGMIVGSATNLSLPTYILSIDSATQVTLSAPATGTAASQSIVFGSNLSLTGDIYVIAIGHNDWTHQNDAIATTPAVMKARLQLLIDIFTAQSSASILLVGEPRANNVVNPETYPADDYWTALDELAAANTNVATVQVNKVWGSFNQAKDKGFVSNPGGVHPLKCGAAHMGQIINDVLTMVPSVGSA